MSSGANNSAFSLIHASERSNIQGYASAVKHTEVIANSTISANSSLPLTSASLSAGSSAMSNAMPVTGAANGTVAERTFYAFASDSANATVTPVNSTDPVSATDFCGYVQGTTVPDHDGGIFFSTLFRVLNGTQTSSL